MKKPILYSLLLLFISCDDILEVPDISDQQVILLAPAEGTSVRGNTTTFSWQAVTDAEEYVLQVATPDFNNASQIVIDSTLAGTSFTGELLPNSYEWRLKAVNSGFETAYAFRNFTVEESDGLSGNTVILSSPADNFATNNTEVTLNWEALNDATEYRIQVEEDTVIFDENY